MVSRILHDLGWFDGLMRQADQESLFFIAMNVWLLRQAGCDWTCPQQFDRLCEREESLTFLTERMRENLRSPLAVSYFGSSRFFPFRRSFTLHEPWGWKDPRNTFTLPLWQKLFPALRVIHVTRHGVDVARSLVTRQAEQYTRVASMTKEALIPFWLRSPLRSYSVALFGQSMDENLALWDAYMQRSAAHVQAMNEQGDAGSRTMTIRYEDLLQQPAQGIVQIADFCRLSADTSTVDRLTSKMDASRAYAYRKCEKASAFAKDHADVLQKHGYSA